MLEGYHRAREIGWGRRVKVIMLGNRIGKGHWLNDYWLEEKYSRDSFKCPEHSGTGHH